MVYENGSRIQRRGGERIRRVRGFFTSITSFKLLLNVDGRTKE